MIVMIRDDRYWHAMSGDYFLMYNLVRFSILSVARIGMKCANLVRRSTMTQIVSCPLDVLGSFVTKSIVIFSYFHIGSSVVPATNRVSLDLDTSCQNLGAQAAGAAPGIKSIWNSTWRMGGRPGRSSGKTSGNSLTIGYEA
uniref:Uncharacterized protein n=1 Tax=Tanacetum cinerariifolium TaxID=118510 RepID=A0A6L2M3R3_TANCI|nr:hypothetical protein [Tanacetum cinerariifolium]